MGVWPFIMSRPEMRAVELIARKASPTPATGYHKQHLAEQKELIDRAFQKSTQQNRKRERVSEVVK